MSSLVWLFLKGILIGLAVAAPVGPVAILCVRQTLHRGLAFGFAVGLGAVMADAAIGTITAVGVAVIREFLLTWQVPLRIVGGLFMLGMGLHSIFARKSDQEAKGSDVAGLLRAFAGALLITGTNPMTFLAFTGIYSAFDIFSHSMTAGPTALLVSGMILGSMIWWGGMALLAAGLKRWFGLRQEMRWLHHVAGGLLVAFGLGTLISLLLV